MIADDPIHQSPPHGGDDSTWEEILARMSGALRLREAERRGVPVEIIEAELAAHRAAENRRFGRRILLYIGLSLAWGFALPILAWHYLPNWLAAIVASL